MPQTFILEARCSQQPQAHLLHQSHQNPDLTNLLSAARGDRKCVAGMLREGDYGTFYQRACERAPGNRPLEFTHVMIDEAGQASLTRGMLRCAVLCCAVLCCAVLCCAVLCCAMHLLVCIC